jgi:Tryptophan-rich Synechocystis species C-terminal domain
MTSTVTITGTNANQYTANSAPLSPFSGVVVSDSLPGQIETVTVNVLPGAHGSLSNVGIGSYDAATGVYTVVGTAAQVTAALEGLVFTPTVSDSPVKCTFGIHVVDSAGDKAFDINTTVTSAHPITIAASATTVLASVGNANGNAFVAENTIGTVMEFLTYNGSVVIAGQFGAWTPVAAKQVGDGYEVVWSNGAGEFVVWNVASNGAYLSAATGIVAGDNAALEANFGELGTSRQFGTTTPPATPTPIATTSTTALASIASGNGGPTFFELNPASGGGTGPLLEHNGALVTAGQFGALTPLAAIQTGNGYEVAWGDGLGDYGVWNVGLNGNYTSAATGLLSSTNPTQAIELAGIEAAFGTSFATGVTAATPTTIGTNGDLAELEVGGSSQNGDAYELGKTGGPLLELNGGVVTKGQFAGGWTPVGALQTGDGYEVAFSNGAGQYEVWNTDGNGNFTSAAATSLSGASLVLAGVEAAFGETFAGAGAAATPTAIGKNGQLYDLEVGASQTGDAFELGAAGVGPLLELNGGVVTKGQFAAGWNPVGAVQTGIGYQVAFENGANQFVVWNTDGNGNFTSAATGILSATSYALESLETIFGEDLNGDGTTGPVVTAIGTNGALSEVANQFQLNPGGGGPFLTLNGSPVTTGEFPAGWTPVGAVQTATGYEVAFGNGAGEYEVWNTDGNGNFTSAATGSLLGNSNELAAVEANFKDGTFTGAGVGPATPQLIKDNTVTTLNSVGNLFELTSDTSGTGPLLELNGSVVTSGEFPAGWTPVGALKTGDGYEVAFGNGKNQYTVWNTDVNGNFTSAVTSAPLAGTSVALQGIEAAFGDETFAGGASPPATASAIGTNGQLAELEVSVSVNGDAYELGGTGGPLLELNGSVVTKGEFPAGWTPVGATKTDDGGYEVAFGNGANQYVVWNTDANGNFTGAATTAPLAGTSVTLQGIEGNFGETFAGAAAPATAVAIATPALGTPGGTILAELEVGGVSHTGDVYELNPAAGGTGPLLEFQGAAVTAGEFGAVAPVGAVQTATGYQVAWSLLGQDEYVVWNTDLNGDYVSSATGTVTGQNFTLEDLNPTFGVNLNGAPSLSQLLFTQPTTGTTLDLSAQTQTATVNLGANNAFSSSIGGLGNANPTVSGPPSSPFKITLGSQADIVEYTLAPASGIEEITGFNSTDELNILLRGAPSTALHFNDTTVGGVAGVSIYSSADPSHGLVLFGETAANLHTNPVGGHALITAIA